MKQMHEAGGSVHSVHAAPEDRPAIPEEEEAQSEDPEVEGLNAIDEADNDEARRTGRAGWDWGAVE